jgi:hypothetical protein
MKKEHTLQLQCLSQLKARRAGDKVTGGDVKQPFAGTPKPGKKVKKG